MCQPDGPKTKGSSGHAIVWDDEGYSHIKCTIKHCPEDEILRALNLTNDDRRHDARPVATADKPKPVEVKRVPLDRLKSAESRSDYTYPDGRYGFSKLRVTKDGKKQFWQCEITSNDIISGLAHLNGTANLLYNLPAVFEAIRTGETIYINEGEKACDRMKLSGMVGTCQRSGAGPGKWLPAHTEWLSGAKQVIIVADRDQVGEEYAREVCKALRDAKIRARVVQSKTTAQKDDAFDHLEAGYSAAEFVDRVDLEPVRGLTSSLLSAYETNPEPVKFVFGQHIRAGQMTLLDADGGTGKTTFAIALAASLSNGFDPFNRGQRPPAKTLIFAAEDSTEDIGVLFAAMGGERGYLLHYAEPFVIDADKLRLLEETIEDGGIELVIFDPLFAVLGVRDFNDAAAITPALERLREIAKRTGAAFLNIRHTNRSAAAATDHRADVGIGSAMIRNAHREVLRVRFHPDTERFRGLRVVSAHKGSIRHEDAEPLGFRRIGDAILWVHDPDMTAFQNPEFGVPSTKESASVWLANYLGETGHRQSDIRHAAETAGLSWRTVERAKKELNVVSYRPTPTGEWCWKMPEKPKEYDPYSDF